MAWKCPECGKDNEDISKGCSCGYAFFKILGVKPDATPESVKQTYDYLVNVWRTNITSKDPVAKKKAEERLKKIDEAYSLFKLNTLWVEEVGEKTNTVKIAVFGAIGVLLVIAAVIMFNLFSNEQTTTVSNVSPQAKPAVSDAQPKPQPPAENLSQPATNQPALSPAPNFPADTNTDTEKTEGWAIESVKKSNVLDRVFNVDSVVQKWTNENSSKFRFLDWQAKKMDDKTYLVSYIASDGLATKGFYFDVNVDTGDIKDIKKHPELQQKYGIKY